MIQASIICVNQIGLFSGFGNSAASPLQYQNVDLTTTVPQVAQTGGFFDSLTSDLFMAGAAAFSAMTMVWKVLVGIVYFKSVIVGIAPFLAGVPAVDSLLSLISVAIDVMIAIAVWIWLFKPGVGENI
jgi:hypothetical protein